LSKHSGQFLRLKELRLAKGTKQEDLEECEVSYRYYGKIERGLVNPTVETLARLSEIFEVSLLDLFAFMKTDGKTSEDHEAVAAKVSQILRGRNYWKIKKLRILLDEIL